MNKEVIQVLSTVYCTSHLTQTICGHAPPLNTLIFSQARHLRLPVLLSLRCLSQRHFNLWEVLGVRKKRGGGKQQAVLQSRHLFVPHF